MHSSFNFKRLLRRALLLALIGLLPLPVHAQTGATLRVASLPITGSAPGSPLPDPLTIPPDDAAGYDLMNNLFVGLFRYDAAEGAAVPVLARDWRISPDGLTWTFTLRQDIPWVSANTATGALEVLRPVVAADFVTAIRRACHPLKPTPASTAMFVIEGCYSAVQFNPVLVTDEVINRLVGVEAPDDVTLVLRLTFPVTFLPSLLTAPEFRAIPREFVDFTAAWPRMAQNGPYVLGASTPGESMTLVRNPFWPDALPGNIDRVTFAFAADPAAAFTSGTADFARLPAGTETVRLPGVVVTRGWTATVLGFSTERPWVSSLDVRRALAFSLNRAALVADDPTVVPITTLTHPAAIGAAGVVEAVVDGAPEAARAALAAAGYPNCAGVPGPIGIGVPRAAEALAGAMIAQWSEVLGCNPALFNVVTVRADALQAIGRDLIDEDANDRIQIWLATYTPEHVDAHGGAADALHCTVGYFFSGSPCDAVDALIDWAVVTPQEDRGDVYRRIEARLFGPAGTFPVVPLYAEAAVSGVSAALSGVTLDGPAWWGAWTKS